MKIKRLFILGAVFLLAGCAKKEYGTRIGVADYTKISLLKDNPGNYIGLPVKVNGKVIEESTRGSWITIQEKDKNKSYVIYVNFDDRPDITLKNLKDRMVSVEGRFVQTREGYFIKGVWCKVLD